MGICDDRREPEKLNCNGKNRVLYTGEKMGGSQKNSRRKRQKAATKTLGFWNRVSVTGEKWVLRKSRNGENQGFREARVCMQLREGAAGLLHTETTEIPARLPTL